MLDLIWLSLRLLLLAYVVWLLTKFIILTFDYIEVLQSAICGKLYAVRKRWFHKLTRRS